MARKDRRERDLDHLVPEQRARAHAAARTEHRIFKGRAVQAAPALRNELIRLAVEFGVAVDQMDTGEHAHAGGNTRAAEFGLDQRAPELQWHWRKQPHAFLGHAVEQWQHADPVDRGRAAADRAIDFLGEGSGDLGMLCEQDQRPNQGVLAGFIGGAEGEGENAADDLLARRLSFLIGTVDEYGKNIARVGIAALLIGPFVDRTLQLGRGAQPFEIGAAGKRPGGGSRVADHFGNRERAGVVVAEQ
jgi:hypothetical protein